MVDQANKMQNAFFPPVDYETWKKETEKSLKGKSFEQLHTNTYENIALKPIYTKEDIQNLPHVKELPGFDSRVRGTHKLGYTLKPWLNSQEIDARSAEELNCKVKHAIANGQSMIHFHLEKNSGLSIKNIEDVRSAFDGVPLDSVPLLIHTKSNAVPLLNLLTTYCLEGNLSLQSIEGTVGMDPLGVLAEEGEAPQPISCLFDRMGDTLTWAKGNGSRIKTIIVSGNPYHNGGANAVQELAFTLATAVEYINELLNRGFNINEITPRMIFFFSVSSNVFMEISKLRAAKILWSTIINALGGDVETAKMNIHARTSAFTKTANDPFVNMLRSTTEAFTAIIGGIDSLHVSSFDEPIKRSDVFSSRIARNTQFILQEESHLHRVIDPAGGSWYVESLTNELAEKVWELFKEIEAKGGMLQSLKSGFVQDQIFNILNERQKNVNVRNDKIVGVNVYANMNEKPLDAPLITKETSVIQENQEVNTGNVTRIKKIPRVRISETFEGLRSAAESYIKQTGERPKVGLINLGAIPSHKPRADFITGFFEAGGFQVIKNDGYETITKAVEGSVALDLTTYVFCGSDETYVEMLEEICKELKRNNPSIRLFVAGRQNKELEHLNQEVGITDYIDRKTDCYSLLYQLQLDMGVRPNG
ncbi:methylmalonyl-CoA mutase family protein [Ferdinandcohnia quinoae]|uniref:methylmalonyl-CoA mutase n=1 Tax=Fredinandcohnia quinoae TaxID=2918902 RepID=A0AAW5E207_9BACI|nr:methylmalonyl-CoA mutase family protein [Fredinandcohnia sp. SECRCQ15]MCH1626648.1 methylmalonyl-CoA mutase subunit beta [Fredinandcohnia sp. SECRCQ15]